jgi:hypothetical protein
VAVDDPSTSTTTSGDDDGGVIDAGPGPAVTSASPSTSGQMADEGPIDGTASSTGPWVDFIAPPDFIDSFECSTFEQDCPRGQKCTVWANDGGPVWNATRCVDVAPDPAQAGEPCTAEGSGVTGVDDCDVGTMCFNVDEDLHGECFEFCMGSVQAPVCPADHTCPIGGDGVLALCIGTCDPLLPSCDAGYGCVSVYSDFVCVPDASGDDGAPGDPCNFINDCDPGSACIDPAAHTTCAGGSGCCSPYCDHTLPDADMLCAALDPNQLCEPWFSPGSAPEGLENVGVCAIPP